MAPYRPVQLPGLPRFFGGAVGYLGYDMVRFIERLPDANPREIGAPDACFMLTEQLLIFDNMRQKIKVVCNVHLQPGEAPENAYARGIAGDRGADRPAARAAAAAPGSRPATAPAN